MMLLAFSGFLPVNTLSVMMPLVKMFFPFAIPSVTSKVDSYDPVPATDEETLLGSLGNKETHTRGSFYRFFDLSAWLTTLAIVSIVLSIRNLLVIQIHPQKPFTNYVEASFARPYTGLEKIPRNKSSPSWPLSSTHYPDFIGATEGTLVHHALNNGSVVRLDPDRRVILQHRARDYGLEYCAVKVEFSHPRGKQHGHTVRAYGAIGANPYFTLWRVPDNSQSKATLTPSALPTTLISDREFLGNITIDAMHATQSPFFDCKAGSIQTLEIAMACASDPCIMEFRLTQSPKRQGFMVVQSEEKHAPP